MSKATPLLFTFLIMAAGSTFAEGQSVHSKVSEALAWELPENSCGQPKIRGVGTGIIDNEGTTRRYDVDTYQIERFERQQKRWKACVSKYKGGLMEDFETLKNSAQYGITQEQANTILGKMALIQSAMTSPDGIPSEG